MSVYTLVGTAVVTLEMEALLLADLELFLTGLQSETPAVIRIGQTLSIPALNNKIQSFTVSPTLAQKNQSPLLKDAQTLFLRCAPLQFYTFAIVIGLSKDARLFVIIIDSPYISQGEEYSVVAAAAKDCRALILGKVEDSRAILSTRDELVVVGESLIEEVSKMHNPNPNGPNPQVGLGPNPSNTTLGSRDRLRDLLEDEDDLPEDEDDLPPIRPPDAAKAT
ncbi:hypothetical protein Tco_1109273 [Tanacetum coccineum]